MSIGLIPAAVAVEPNDRPVPPDSAKPNHASEEGGDNGRPSVIACGETVR